MYETYICTKAGCECEFISIPGNYHDFEGQFCLLIAYDPSREEYRRIQIAGRGQDHIVRHRTKFHECNIESKSLNFESRIKNQVDYCKRLEAKSLFKINILLSLCLRSVLMNSTIYNLSYLFSNITRMQSSIRFDKDYSVLMIDNLSIKKLSRSSIGDFTCHLGVLTSFLEEVEEA
eukprot:NODE_6305_length_901_cov_18.542416_g5713_i0.p1 GENE.NODE_6305_length_901_cov_18.542416_g5713_i0~~NODE_6305_length_901_cov_18.542416_g5713_i0.p1  ORF type:complete len:191 (+),score=5.73 NODE_6305_length_901_cov_18.542416_g5713_i0:47-574(+)